MCCSFRYLGWPLLLGAMGKHQAVVSKAGSCWILGRILETKGHQLFQIYKHCWRLGWDLHALRWFIFHMPKTLAGLPKRGDKWHKPSAKRRIELELIEESHSNRLHSSDRVQIGTFAIATVEITIARNRIDLSRAPLGNAGPLNPFPSSLINMLVICWWRSVALMGHNQL